MPQENEDWKARALAAESALASVAEAVNDTQTNSEVRCDDAGRLARRIRGILATTTINGHRPTAGCLDSIDDPPGMNDRQAAVHHYKRAQAAESALASARKLLEESKLPYTGGLSFGEKRDAARPTPAESPAIVAAERAVLDACAAIPMPALKSWVTTNPVINKQWLTNVCGAELARRADCGTEGK